MSETVTAKKQRMANIELLRIISMLMVITLHFLSRGKVLENAQMLTGNWFLAINWDALAIVSVDIYILISGYFLINSKFRFQKLIDIVIAVFTYSVVLYVLFVLIGVNAFSIKGFISSCIPVLTGKYWFASVYVGLYALSPFINKGLHALDEKQHRNLIIVMILCFSLYFPAKVLGQSGTTIAWMICCYCIGAYLRLYYKPNNKVTLRMVICYLVAFLALPASKIAITLASVKVSEKLIVYNGWFYKYNSVFVILAAVALFVIFLNINIRSKFVSKTICAIGPLTFGVYLFHNNPSLRDKMWEILNLPAYMSKWWFFFMGVGVIVLIFAASAIVEFIRKKVYTFLINTKCYSALFNRIADSKPIKLLNK